MACPAHRSPSHRSPQRALTAALRAAGFDREQAERLIRLHLAVEAERFGTGRQGSPSPALLSDIEAALREVPRRLRPVSGLAAALARIGAARRQSGRPSAPAQPAATLYARGSMPRRRQAFRNGAASPRPAGTTWPLRNTWPAGTRTRWRRCWGRTARRATGGSRRCGMRSRGSTSSCAAPSGAGRSPPRRALRRRCVLLWLGAILFVLAPAPRTPGGRRRCCWPRCGRRAGLLRYQQRVPEGGAGRRVQPAGVAPRPGAGARDGAALQRRAARSPAWAAGG